MGNIIISEKLKFHFLKLYQMALADEDFSKQEMKMLYEFALERGVSEKDLDEILTQTDYQEHIPETLEEKIEFLYDLTQMIWADGKVDENERSALEKYIISFGFLDENVVPLADFFLESVKNGVSKSEIIQNLNN